MALYRPVERLFWGYSDNRVQSDKTEAENTLKPVKRKIFRFIQFSLGMIGTDVLTLPKNKRKRVCALNQIWSKACTKGKVVSDTRGGNEYYKRGRRYFSSEFIKADGICVVPPSAFWWLHGSLKNVLVCGTRKHLFRQQKMNRVKILLPMDVRYKWEKGYIKGKRASTRCIYLVAGIINHPWQPCLPALCTSSNPSWDKYSIQWSPVGRIRESQTDRWHIRIHWQPLWNLL